MIKIAVLLTTFNRREKTLSCLESLQQQVVHHDMHLEVFITDDASSDGTADAVKQSFPNVNVYKGSGSLYWAGGMRHTWNNALPYNPDYFLLLNDDTVLYKNSIEILLNYSIKNSKAAICIGSTKDVVTKNISYGGSKIIKKNRWGSSLAFSPTDYVECDFGNANIMLVSKEVVDKIGILSDAFTHSLADYDYGLKAKKTGFSVVTAPGFLGECTDDHGNNWKSQKTSLKERIEFLKSPKGLAYSEYLHFIKTHFPLSLPAEFCKIWLKTFFPFIWDNYKK